jgi:hypothetical protein
MCERGLGSRPVSARRPLLPLLAAAVVVSGCGGGDDKGAATTAVAPTSATTTTRYPADVRANFLESCEVQGTPAKCRCALAQIEQRMTIAAFRREEASISAGNGPGKVLRAAVAACG